MLRTVFNFRGSLQLLQQFTLAFIELLRSLYMELYEQISFAVAIENRNPLATDASL